MVGSLLSSLKIGEKQCQVTEKISRKQNVLLWKLSFPLKKYKLHAHQGLLVISFKYCFPCYFLKAVFLLLHKHIL